MPQNSLVLKVGNSTFSLKITGFSLFLLMFDTVTPNILIQNIFCYAMISTINNSLLPCFFLQYLVNKEDVWMIFCNPWNDKITTVLHIY